MTRSEPDRAPQEVLVDRGLEHDGRPGELRRPGPDVVHLDVVGVPVAARGVVAREHVRALLPQDGGQARRRLLDVQAAGALLPGESVHLHLDAPEPWEVAVGDVRDPHSTDTTARPAAAPHAW